MDDDTMSDVELRFRLEERGFLDIPITASTRALLIKKVRAANPKPKKSLNNKSRNSLNPTSNNSLNDKLRNSLNKKSRNSLNTRGDTPSSFVPQNYVESQTVLDNPTLMENSLDNVYENPTPIPDLDPDVLLALGVVSEDKPIFDEKINDNLSRLWHPILLKGIEKEAKEKLMKEYQIPENCTLLQAPKLNPEIAVTVPDSTRNNDKLFKSAQQQLGHGIAALNKGLSLLLENGTERVKAIKFLSDSSRILCDLHHVETEARKEFITPGLNKALLNLIQGVDRDESLFGKTLSEKTKASKVIEQQEQIRQPVTSAYSAPTSRLRSQADWAGPSSYAASTSRQSLSSQPQQNQNRSRAPAQKR